MILARYSVAFDLGVAEALLWGFNRQVLGAGRQSSLCEEGTIYMEFKINAVP